MISPPAEVLINVCLTGMVAGKRDNPALPITATEIARDTAACIERGAAIVHVHARDEDGAPAWTTASYQRILHAIREVSEEVIVCVSTSGRLDASIERRCACLLTDPAPDMASLTLGSVDFLRASVLNSHDTVRELARRMDDRGVRPELEIFGLGMARMAARLLDEQAIQAPAYANLILGNVGSAAADADDLEALVRHLPETVVWATGGIGRHQAIANELGLRRGAGVRIGLEDNLYLDSDRTPATNPALVERVVAAAQALGRKPATIAQARHRLGL